MKTKPAFQKTSAKSQNFDKLTLKGDKKKTGNEQQLPCAPFWMQISYPS